MPSPPRRPPPVRSKSCDDLEAVSALDAAESRARASLRLAEENAARVEELETALERARNSKLHADEITQVSVIDSAALLAMAKGPPPPPEKPISLSPQALTFRGHHWKIVIPFTLVLALGPLIWALASDYIELKSQLKKQTEAFNDAQKRFDVVDQKVSEVSRSVSALRETVAELSGYLAGVLPKAGVKVPGTEPGAVPMNIISDPLPVGAKRQQSVTTHTLVPAPKPP